MAEDTIDEGNVVILKSGGPKMTVVWVDEFKASCTWFDKDQKIQQQSFNLSSLERESGESGFF